MKNLDKFLERNENMSQRDLLQNLFQKILEDFPELEPRVAWNQLMFTIRGTVVIGFSVSNNYLSVFPEVYCLKKYIEDISESGYAYTENSFHIKWTDSIDVLLIKKMISFKIGDKNDVS